MPDKDDDVMQSELDLNGDLEPDAEPEDKGEADPPAPEAAPEPKDGDEPKAEAAPEGEPKEGEPEPKGDEPDPDLEAFDKLRERFGDEAVEKFMASLEPEPEPKDEPKAEAAAEPEPEEDDEDDQGFRFARIEVKSRGEVDLAAQNADGWADKIEAEERRLAEMVEAEGEEIKQSRLYQDRLAEINQWKGHHRGWVNMHAQRAQEYEKITALKAYVDAAPSLKRYRADIAELYRKGEIDLDTMGVREIKSAVSKHREASGKPAPAAKSVLSAEEKAKKVERARKAAAALKELQDSPRHGNHGAGGGVSRETKKSNLGPDAEAALEILTS